MPSKERYEREKARAATEGTTPYRRRVSRAREQYGRGVSRATAEGHARDPFLSLSARRSRRKAREAEGLKPGTWCYVCGADVALVPGVRTASGAPRPHSFSCRPCGAEQMRRYRRSKDGTPAMDWLERLADDSAWVAERRAEERKAGRPLRGEAAA